MSGPENSGMMHHDLLVNQTDDYVPAIKPLVHTTLTEISNSCLHICDGGVTPAWVPFNDGLSENNILFSDSQAHEAYSDNLIYVV